MASAGSIFVDLILRDAKYSEGFRKAAANTSIGAKAISKSVEGATKSFAALGAKIIGLATVGGFIALTKNSLEAAGALNDLSESLGISTTELQKYQYAAGLAGVQSETLQTALAKLNSNIAEGVLPYKTTSDALQDISDRVKGASTNIERAAIVNEAFGAKLGSKLIPLLLKGSEGIAQLGREAEKFGAVINSETIEAADKFGDEMDTLGKVIRGNFASGFLGGFVKDSDDIRDIYTDPQFIQGIKDIGAAFAEVAKAAGDAVKFLSENKEDILLLSKVVAGAAVGARFGGGLGAAAGAAGAFGYSAIPDKRKDVTKDTFATTDELARLREAVQLEQGMVEVADQQVKKNVELVATKQQLKEQDDAVKRQQNELNQLYERNVELFDGLTDAQREYNEKLSALEKLYQAGRINQEQFSKGLETISKQLNETGSELSKYAERAAENIQDAFADFLFDPFQDGLDGMLKGFVDTLRKMIAQQAAAELLGGGKDGKGGLSGLLQQGLAAAGPAFAGFFADGGFIPPGSWGVVGEEGAEAIYGGKSGATVVPNSSGSNVYNIDARGADQGAVVRLEAALLNLAGPGVIERRVTQAQVRGQL